MASSKEFLDFVLEQLSSLRDITYRAMMGEYIIYYRGKIIGGIYDNRLLIPPRGQGKHTERHNGNSLSWWQANDYDTGYRKPRIIDKII